MRVLVRGECISGHGVNSTKARLDRAPARYCLIAVEIAVKIASIKLMDVAMPLCAVAFKLAVRLACTRPTMAEVVSDREDHLNHCQRDTLLRCTHSSF
jgi:hypothetical protein